MDRDPSSSWVRTRGEAQAGQIICGVYDGTIFQVQSTIAPATLTEKTKTGFTNLRLKNNAANPSAQIDIT